MDTASQQSICSIIITLKPAARCVFSVQSSRINVTFIWTRYSVICPLSSTITSWFSIHAALTFRRVFWARATPVLIASSKLFVEDALISVTRATDIVCLVLGVLRLWGPGVFLFALTVLLIRTPLRAVLLNLETANRFANNLSTLYPKVNHLIDFFGYYAIN